ncbi:MAG: endonuclease/exonuclease/phosphatase family protein [Candidatus Paceibacterota bacterium]|jgi:exonuclease III
MKLITLNVWGGKLYQPLADFLEKRSKDTDIFCFQDTLFGSKPEFSPVKGGRINLFEETKKILEDFNSFVYRDPEESYFHGELLPLNVGCGQAIFVRNTVEILENGGFRSHPESPYHKGGDMVSGRCQWVKLKENEEEVTILNLHGLWQRNSMKRDTPERMEQSKKIKDFFNGHNGKKILCGDFNIINDGNAMSLLEEDMTNLIKKYEITSTRSSHYPKEEKYADYVLISENVEDKNFQVLTDEVSDHLPLLLEFK